MPVHKATIVPRGSSLGMVAQLPDKDQDSLSRKQMLARLNVAMGGRAAEELIFGDNEVTSGASHDFKSATDLARLMVTKFGMSKAVGHVVHDYANDGNNMSTETRLLVEKEVRDLLQSAYENAKHILTTRQEDLHVLAKALLEHETLSGNQIKQILAEAASPSVKPAIVQTSVSPSSPSPSPSPSPSLPAESASVAVTAKGKTKGVTQAVGN